MTDLHFKRRISDVLPVADGDDAYIVQTLDGKLWLVDSLGGHEIVTAEDVVKFAEHGVAITEELIVRIEAQKQSLTELRSQNERLVIEYNKAIEVINDLSERVAALESNYDPTVIK